jgi:hypothetical protein
MKTWRDQYRVHPAADVFPMLDDEELHKLGEDIRRTGLKHQIILSKDGVELLDGRNRLEAMERAGIPLNLSIHTRHYGDGDPVALIVASNIHRRHLTKQQQADLIVAAHKAAAEKPRQVGEVSGASRRSASGPPERPASPPEVGGRSTSSKRRFSPTPRSTASASAPSRGRSQRLKADYPSHPGSQGQGSLPGPNLRSESGYTPRGPTISTAVRSPTLISTPSGRLSSKGFESWPESERWRRRCRRRAHRITRTYPTF